MNVYELFPIEWSGLRVMSFVDGENLAIRFKNIQKLRGTPKQFESFAYREDEVLWSNILGDNVQSVFKIKIFRCHYYTCVKGSQDEVRETKELLRRYHIAAPRVFPRAKRDGDKARKQVDIALATEMVANAYRNNYDAAIIVTGDEDFLPVIEEVARCGKMISLWSFPKSLSPKLKLASDHFVDLEKFLWDY